MRGITSRTALGSAIRGARMRNGLTQAQLAARAGVSRATVIKVESGGRFEIATLFALTKALGLELALEERRDGGPSILDHTDEL
jgi:HTH-type transcriptional regulator/antitoxin HipB